MFWIISNELVVLSVSPPFHFLVAYCATLFRALLTATGGDGMRKKDTEIPPKRAFI
jgi:hypothetical protein